MSEGDTEKKGLFGHIASMISPSKEKPPTQEAAAEDAKTETTKKPVQEDKETAKKTPEIPEASAESSKRKSPEEDDMPTRKRARRDVGDPATEGSAESSKRKSSEDGDEPTPGRKRRRTEDGYRETGAGKYCLAPLHESAGHTAGSMKRVDVTNLSESELKMELPSGADPPSDVYNLDPKTRHAIVRKFPDAIGMCLPTINDKKLPVALHPGLAYCVDQGGHKIKPCGEKDYDEGYAKKVLTTENGVVTVQDHCEFVH